MTIPSRLRVFLANSGTEANEAAFKTARRHGGSRHPRVLALGDTFHGRTMGALALTYKAAYRSPSSRCRGVEFIPADVESFAHRAGAGRGGLLISSNRTGARPGCVSCRRVPGGGPPRAD